MRACNFWIIVMYLCIISKGLFILESGLRSQNLAEVKQTCLFTRLNKILHFQIFKREREKHFTSISESYFSSSELVTILICFGLISKQFSFKFAFIKLYNIFSLKNGYFLHISSAEKNKC